MDGIAAFLSTPAGKAWFLAGDKAQAAENGANSPYTRAPVENFGEQELVQIRAFLNSGPGQAWLRINEQSYAAVLADTYAILADESALEAGVEFCKTAGCQKPRGHPPRPLNLGVPWPAKRAP